MGLFATAAGYEAENQPFALIQLVDRRGSTPLRSATMLVDSAGEITGTLGGGMLERLAIREGVAAIRRGESRLFEARLARRGANAVGSDCGGAVTIHIAVYPARPKLFLLGAGHVNREVARAAGAAGFVVTACDSWEKNLGHPDLPPNCARILGSSFHQIVQQLPLDEHSFVVIATNHQDFEALAAVLAQPLAYLGLLGSRRKVQTLRNRLVKECQATPEALARLHAPLGLAIGAQTPAELAVSIVGELIQTWRQPRALPEPARQHDADAVPLAATLVLPVALVNPD